MISEIQSYNSAVSTQNKNKINNKIHFKNNGSWLSVVNSRQAEDAFSRMGLSMNPTSMKVLNMMSNWINIQRNIHRSSDRVGLTRYLIFDLISGVVGKGKGLKIGGDGVMISGRFTWNNPDPPTAEEAERLRAHYNLHTLKQIPDEPDVKFAFTFDKKAINAHEIYIPKAEK